MVRAIAEQILPIDVSNLKKLVRDEISVVKRPGKFIVAHIPHPQLAHRQIEGIKVNHPR